MYKDNKDRYVDVDMYTSFAISVSDDGHVGVCEDKTGGPSECIPSLESLDPSDKQLIADLETGDLEIQTLALEKIVCMIQNGENIQGLMIPITRFVIPSPNIKIYEIKNILCRIFETIQENHPCGELTQEMILVCAACRESLQSPDELIRSSTRWLLFDDLKEPELLVPLMPTILACLEDRDSYVRKIALYAIETIYNNYNNHIYSSFDFHLPDVPELIASFLDGEQDTNLQYEAFRILKNIDKDRLLSYLSTCKVQVQTFGVHTQLHSLILIEDVCGKIPSEKSRFIPCIYNFLKSTNTEVLYTAAQTLVELSDDTDAVKTAISAYIDIIIEEGGTLLNNNLNVDVLESLVDMRHSPAHEKILAEKVMDILRVLRIPSLEVKMKILSLAMELVTSRDMKEVVLIFKEEIRKTFGTNQEDIGEYRKFLIRALQCTCTKFPEQYSLDIIDKDGKNRFKNHTEKIKMKMKRYREKDENNQIIFAEQKEKIAKLEEKNSALEEKNSTLEEKISVLEEMNSSVKEKMTALQEKYACKICLNKDVETVFLPCGHLACEICGHKVSDCHICRESIQKKPKIFMS